MMGVGLDLTARRACRWLPSSTSGNVLWLPASLSGLYQDDGAATPVAANADPIGYRSELSASGLYLVQATAGRRATWGAATFGTGKPALIFDGVDDRLERAATVAPMKTLQIAFRMRSVAGSGVFYTPFHIAQSNGACWVMHIGQGGGYQNLSIGCNNASTAGVGVAGVGNDAAAHVITFRYTGSSPTSTGSWRIRVDGVDQTVTTTAAMAVSAGNSVVGIYPSGVLPAPMDLACILGWTPELEGTDLANSESYLTSLLS